MTKGHSLAANAAMGLLVVLADCWSLPALVEVVKLVTVLDVKTPKVWWRPSMASASRNRSWLKPEPMVAMAVKLSPWQLLVVLLVA